MTQIDVPRWVLKAQVMTREFALGIACTWLLGGLAACSGVDQDPQLAGRGDHATESTQALDSQTDRQAAAAVGVLVDSAPTLAADHALRATRQLWLFACSSDHILQRRVRADRHTPWGDWSVESATPCAGAPSASAWSVSPRDTVEVVYRSTDNRLIELTYSADQTKETDLSAYTHFGNLASNCNPVIADMGNEQRVSIAVRNPANQLFTLTAYSGAWHVQPARGPNGAQVFAESTLVSWYSNQAALLSAVHNGVSQAFYRTSWKQGFRASSQPIPAEVSHGLITFGSYQGRVQAVGRTASGALVASPVEGQWRFVPAAAHSALDSTVYLSAPFSYRSATGTSTAALGVSHENANGVFVGGFEAFQRTAAPRIANAHIASANALVANPGPELWGDNFVADASGQLLYWSGGTDQRFTPMGLAVSY